MIILPDRNIPRSKFLVPIHINEWREPSQAVPRDQLGNPVTYSKFRIRAKTHDGVVIWTGWFDDREDFDAFLYAIAIRTLNKEKSLWRLPNPNWLGYDLDLSFAADKLNWLTSTTVANWEVPKDYTTTNSFEALGGGGDGPPPFSAQGGGGGGGAYAKIVNQSFTIGSLISYQCGQGGKNAGGLNPPIAAVNTYFNNTSTLVAASGSIGVTGGGTGPGGTVANSVGTTRYAGGAGASAYSNSYASSGGGGGSAGPDGGGSASNASGSTGGDGNAGNAGGGTGGGTLAKGGDGTYWQSSPAYGPGGGGGGKSFAGNATGGNGGNYGGAGAGNNGSGVQGLIVITYTPKLLTGFNLPMLGM